MTTNLLEKFIFTTPDRLKELMDEYDITPMMFQTNMSLKKARCQKVLEQGIQDEQLQRRFDLYLMNRKAEKQFTSSDVARVLERLNVPQVELSLMLGIGLGSLHKMMAGEYKITAQNRKLIKIIEWCLDQDIDPVEFIGRI